MQQQALRTFVNQSFAGKDAYQIVLRTLGGALAFTVLYKFFSDPKEFKASIVNIFFKWAKKIPGVKGAIDKELGKAMKDLKKSLGTPGTDFRTIPEHGKSYQEVLDMMREAQRYDLSKQANHNHSGTIYLGDDAHTEFTNQAFGMFSLSNPLHAEVFPNARKFESEIVSMTARMLHGGPEVCGAMTSGGTESILMAVKAYRDWAKDTKGITHPELVAPITVHSAFDKACHYFGIKLVHIDTSSDFKVDLKAVRKAINGNTIALVGSAPNFPNGMIDDIEGLAAIAREHKIGMHVDGCLGGFVLPFIAKLEKYGSGIPVFDFRVNGVTSMSADTHKYGYAPKGTSVVLFHNKELRHYMFFSAPNWTGGMYGSPTMAGSRPGGLAAAAWAALIAIGQDGYLKHAQAIMETTEAMIEGIKAIPDLHILGNPKAMVVAFGSKNINIFKINAAMGKRGWDLCSLQRPVAIHMCVTAKHAGTGPKFVQDLRASVDEVKQNPDLYKDSSAALYGMAAGLPDRTIVTDMILGVLDTMLDA